MVKSQQPRLRRLLVVESARIMAEEGVADFRAAKEKAARRLGIAGEAQQLWPSNAEVHAELQSRLALFHGDAHDAELQHLRRTALAAMNWLGDFAPRLSGPVLEGTATGHSAIVLHLFADTPESVLFFLLDQGASYEEGRQMLHFGEQTPREYPVLRLPYAGCELRLVIFGLDEDRRSPASPVDGKPLRRINAAQLQRLLDASPAASPLVDSAGR
ncbi:nucleotidyltransferase [Acidithiobacillus sp.]|uniref:nucleotidyltransferase n=1 Tax=Acidithiobacillus sp. TaxID=1872118 RepID=UPI003D006AF9